MARGGLSDDPDVRERQLAGLELGRKIRASNVRRSKKSATPAKPKGKDDDVGRLTYDDDNGENGEPSTGKRRRRSPTRKPRDRQPERRREPKDEAEPTIGFKDGFLAPFQRTYD